MFKKIIKWTAIGLFLILKLFLIIIVSFLLFLKITNTTIIMKDNKLFDAMRNVTEQDFLNYFERPIIKLIDQETKEEIIIQYSDFEIIQHVSNFEEMSDDLFVSFDDIESRISYDFDDAVLNDCIMQYVEDFNKDKPDFIYPTLEMNENGFYVKEEIPSKKLNASAVCTKIYEGIGDTIVIYISDVAFERDNSKPTMDKLQQEVDNFNTTYILYKNGFQIKACDFKDYYYIENEQILFKTELKSELKKDVDKIIDVELAEYDTVGKGFDFITTNGEAIKVTGGTWGNIFSSDLESDYIVEMLSLFSAEVDREPIYRQEYAKEIAGRYVEISLSQQHLWFYDNGELVMETDIVTGTNNTSRETPTGVYYISEMIPGKYLRGRDYVTWVNRWMRITNRGHGLHDAYWRDAFGGDIYERNGSHGCINLPKDFAYQLYDMLKVNDCVVIYN